MAGPAAAIPDAHTTAADLSLQYVALNRRINANYGCFGQLFQTIIEPAFGGTAVSSVPAQFVSPELAGLAAGLIAALVFEEAHRDRWAPIVDIFWPCCRNPQAMWPALNPDPNGPI